MDVLTMFTSLFLLYAIIPYTASRTFRTCDRYYSKMGCVEEAHTDMTLLVNHRLQIDWHNFQGTMHSLACECSEKARAAGYQYFSIRFWAECWVGHDLLAIKKVLNDESKKAETCVGGDYKPCNHGAATECAGTNMVEYVFLVEPPVDGGLSTWSTWSKCDKTCGGGTQQSSRMCNNPAPQYGGKNCTEPLKRTQACNTKECLALGCNYDVVEDGNGKIEDIKQQCTEDKKGSIAATECIRKDEQFANKRYVGKIILKLENIGSLLSCKKKCIGNEKCNSWTYYNDGRKQCQLKKIDSDTYKIEDGKNRISGLLGCRYGKLVDGGLSTWSTWSKCNKKCGGGTQKSSRKCNNPVPKNGGKDCSGTLKRTRACNTGECPVHGGLSTWSTWSKCDKTCGAGTQQSSRMCNNPAPAHGGRDCTGTLKRTQACNAGECPVDGGWSTWSTWSKCDKTCGAGTQQSSRMCNNPNPAHGGKDCTGPQKRMQACNAGECPVDGGVSLWSGWSGCSKSCDHGTKTRRRTCTNPAPAHGGKACTEQLTETTGCYLRQCGCSNTYRYLGSSKGCGPKYTSQGGRCDGWQRMGLSRCQQLCNQNAAPGGCARRECHFVIWAQNPGTPPGWCQLGDKNCREHRANPPHHLYARNC